MPGWRDRARAALGRGGKRPEAIFEDLRSIALTVDAAQLELREPSPGALVALMEIGTPKGVATFVAVADGSVSMYTSVGGGVVGAGEHESVRAAARHFLREAAESRDLLQRTTAFTLPAVGEVRFQVRLSDGGYTGAAPAAALRGRHPLARLYAAGEDLITEIRLLDQPDGGRRPN